MINATHETENMDVSEIVSLTILMIIDLAEDWNINTNAAYQLYNTHNTYNTYNTYHTYHTYNTYNTYHTYNTYNTYCTFNAYNAYNTYIDGKASLV